MRSPAKRRVTNLLAVAAFAMIAIIGISLNNRSIRSKTAPTPPATDAPVLELVPEPSDRTPMEEDLVSALWKTVLITGLMLATIVAGAWGLKRFGANRLQQSSSSEMRILGRKYLSAKQSIAIVKVREKELLLGITDHSIQLLIELTTEEEDPFGSEFAKTPVEAKT